MRSAERDFGMIQIRLYNSASNTGGREKRQRNRTINVTTSVETPVKRAFRICSYSQHPYDTYLNSYTVNSRATVI